ncbi:MAG: hypothetical protein KIC98_05260 [Clostridioides difficile]|nr:hypothetical protein [Clostridioides difficile]
MNLSLDKEITVSTNFIKSNPAVPICVGDEVHALIYHIEIGYNNGRHLDTRQYIIIDYKEYNLSKDKRDQLIEMAKKYCESKGILDDESLEIELLDNEEAENFIEKVFNNMKIIKGLITQGN